MHQKRHMTEQRQQRTNARKQSIDKSLTSIVDDVHYAKSMRIIATVLPIGRRTIKTSLGNLFATHRKHLLESVHLDDSSTGFSCIHWMKIFFLFCLFDARFPKLKHVFIFRLKMLCIRATKKKVPKNWQEMTITFSMAQLPLHVDVFKCEKKWFKDFYTCETEWILQIIRQESELGKNGLLHYVCFFFGLYDKHFRSLLRSSNIQFDAIMCNLCDILEIVR